MLSEDLRPLLAALERPDQPRKQRERVFWLHPVTHALGKREDKTPSKGFQLRDAPPFQPDPTITTFQVSACSRAKSAFFFFFF